MTTERTRQWLLTRGVLVLLAAIVAAPFVLNAVSDRYAKSEADQVSEELRLAGEAIRQRGIDTVAVAKTDQWIGLVPPRPRGFERVGGTYEGALRDSPEQLSVTFSVSWGTRTRCVHGIIRPSGVSVREEVADSCQVPGLRERASGGAG